MFQVCAEVILWMKCVSCLVYYSIGRSLEGLEFVLSDSQTLGAVLAPTGCGKSYYLFIPHTLTPPYVTNTFLSLCHISIHMNELTHHQDGDSLHFLNTT